ncbi:NAD-dependent epimerase/dehydratase family protein [Bacteroidales bacterium OttesenSCG-928-I21]|nr:NAD-dependent epimerase/dehydratase family protein [Bacteroidales bacterium OttesenSCG-928-I21]
MNELKKILIIGSAGQIGSELVLKLRTIYGNDNVIASDIKNEVSEAINNGPYEKININNRDEIVEVVKKYGIDSIINFAAILSANGEKKPMLAWNVNVNGYLNVLEIARELKLKRVLTPSSIAAFGPSTPRDNTPQETVLKPTTIYGISKVTGELLGDYYVNKYGLDVRGLRYPGIISHATLPGGGTTDYAVAIYFDAVKYKKYTCFVNEETRLPMMYMPDCLKATVDLLQADKDKLIHHGDFNVGAMSFSAGELAASIKKYIPDFQISYEPDFRQAIADSWPMSVDDSAARKEWGWKPEYDLDAMTKDMISAISEKYKKGIL